MLLVVVEDRHAESALRQALDAARQRGADVVVLTADALLAMRLEREGIAARRTIHGMEDPATHRPDGNPVLDSRDALVLEPGFMATLFVKAFWRRITGPAPPAPHPEALIVVGDRFTADVVERLTGASRQIVLAGATQPGRALFANASALVPLEAFGRWTD